MKKLLLGVAALGAILYPLVIYFGLTRFQPRYLALFMGVLLLIKIANGNVFGPLAQTHSRQIQNKQPARYLDIVIAIIVAVLVAYTWVNNQPGGLKLYPVVISFSLLAGFGWSLFYPPAIIERIARITAPDLPPSGVRYTRKLTLVWCGFFLCNGLAALYTALYTSFEVWALYNGLIAYVLIGCLLGGEFLYRCRFLKKG